MQINNHLIADAKRMCVCMGMFLFLMGTVFKSRILIPGLFLEAAASHTVNFQSLYQ